jgi:predicted Zn-dependent protease
MLTNETYELFERFLQGELNESEQSDLDQKIVDDPEWAEAFSLYQSVDQHLRFHKQNQEQTAQLKQTLRQIGNETLLEKTKKPVVIQFFNRNKVWMAAASILLLVGLFIFKDGQPAYVDFAQHATMELTVRGANQTTEIEAQNSFNQGNYKQAETLLKDWLQKEPDNAEVQLYYGISLLENNHMMEAQKVFKDLEKNELFKNTAYWYLALTSLKEKDYKTCESYLKQINTASSEGKKARRLLKKL